MKDNVLIWRNDPQASMWQAVNDGNLEAYEKSRAAGANIHELGDHGRIPLHIAALKGHATLCARLIADGADVDAVDSGLMAPLHLAVWSGHHSVVCVLLEAGASLENGLAIGDTPLHIAVEKIRSR